MQDVRMLSRVSSNPTLLPGFPDVYVSLNSFKVRIADDPFECAISRNYRRGRHEQLLRLERAREFKRMAVLKGKERRSALGGTSPEIQEAFWLLQELNSNAWIARCRQAEKDASQGTPTLFEWTCKLIFLRACAPVLPVPDNIGRSLHALDPDTPSTISYTSVIARQVSLDFDELLVQLRDYPCPLLHIPSCNGSWNTSGLVVLADPDFGLASTRTVRVSLDPLPLPALFTVRSLNPPKLYVVSKSVFQSSVSIRAAYGSCIEPALADFVRVLDGFAKPTPDPSPPVGWWDKMRLMAHGSHTFVVRGGGDVRVLVYGSHTPYFDPRFDHGTAGAEFRFSRGVHIALSDNMSITSGACSLSIPQTKHEIKRDLGHGPVEGENVVARLAGGVSFHVTLAFMVRNSHDDTEVPPNKCHSDIVYVHPDFCLDPKVSLMHASCEPFSLSPN
jgi:hypothetical protein